MQGLHAANEASQILGHTAGFWNIACVGQQKQVIDTCHLKLRKPLGAATSRPLLGCFLLPSIKTGNASIIANHVDVTKYPQTVQSVKTSEIHGQP